MDLIGAMVLAEIASAAQAAQAGGLNPRPLNAPPAGQPGVGVQPGTTTGILIGRLVLVFGPTGSVSGVFVYATGTTPAPGNQPIVSITNQTVDPFGNPTLPGVAVYSATGNAQLLNNSLTFTNPGAGGSIQFGGGSLITEINGTLSIQNGVSTTNRLTIAMPIFGGLFAVHPGTSFTGETWQDPTSSLVGFGHNGVNLVFKYILQADGMVEFDGEMAATGAYAAGTTIFTLPPGYRPAANCSVNANAVTAGGTVAGFLGIAAATGAVSFGSNLAAGNVIIGNGGRYRLVS